MSEEPQETAKRKPHKAFGRTPAEQAAWDRDYRILYEVLQLRRRLQASLTPGWHVFQNTQPWRNEPSQNFFARRKENERKHLADRKALYAAHNLVGTWAVRKRIEELHAQEAELWRLLPPQGINYKPKESDEIKS